MSIIGIREPEPEDGITYVPEDEVEEPRGIQSPLTDRAKAAHTEAQRAEVAKRSVMRQAQRGEVADRLIQRFGVTPEEIRWDPLETSGTVDGLRFRAGETEAGREVLIEWSAAFSWLRFDGLADLGAAIEHGIIWPIEIEEVRGKPEEGEEW